MTERKTRALSVEAEARARSARLVDVHLGQQWPSPRWQADPVGFATTVLGVELWSFQVRFLEAIRDHRHVACAGGRKIGKDFVVAVASLWWYASWPRAKVFLLAPTAKQLDGIVYLEIRQLMSQTGRCLRCRTAYPDGPRPCPHSAVLSGDVGMLARTGVRGGGFRHIVGQTAISGGGLRGFSGSKVLAIEDEASDIKDDIDTALVGNLAAADCHRVAISNPTKVYGFFYRAFHEERHTFFPIQQSSEEAPNVVEGREVFPGLATREWLEERERAWGRGTALWAANVDGKFPVAAQGQLFPLEVVRAAVSAKKRASANREGRLQIGIDVAGAGQDGDETAFAPRRGDYAEEILRRRGLTPDQILDLALELLAKYRQDYDWGDSAKPVIVVDRDGSVGAKVYDVFKAYRSRNAQNEAEFKLVGFQGGAPPIGRMKDSYRMNRDLLFASLVEWVKDGGTFPDDLKLEGELVALRWLSVEMGKSQLEPKSNMRDRLGRSPDSADALALSVWGERRESAVTHAAVTPAATRETGDANQWAYGAPQATNDADQNEWAYQR